MSVMGIKNLYLPVLGNNKSIQSRQKQRILSTSKSNNTQLTSVLKKIQQKKALLQRAHAQNQESETYQQKQEFAQQKKLNVKYKIFPLYNKRHFNENQKLKTLVIDSNQQNQKSLPESSFLKYRNFRVRTQQNENQSKLRVQVQQATKNSQLKGCESYQQEGKNQEIQLMHLQGMKSVNKMLKISEITIVLQKLVQRIPKKTKERNQASLRETLNFLRQYNPFFMKLDKVVATCLLKVCNIIKRHRRQLIYQKDVINNKFYLILSGKVRITNSQVDLKKVCVAGETLLEQEWVVLNQQRKERGAYERARAMRESVLLQIGIDKFKKVKQELTKFGFKTQYNELESLIKRNYIFKNSLRLQKNKF